MWLLIYPSVKATSRGELFLQYDSGINDENRIAIFCIDKNLVHLANAKTVLCDGTFKSYPPGFLQSYTFVSCLNRSNVPLVYVLMKTKSAIGYKKIVDLFKNRISQFNPEQYILDFKIAPREVFGAEYPTVK